MNDITIFENEKFGKIRTVGTADNPYFCLTDICKILGLRVDGVLPRLKKDGYNQIVVIDTLGRKQNAYFVNEQNLYKVIMRSDKPIAEPFQDWVCGDVLPTIRKTGSYGIPQTFAQALRLAAEQQEQIEAQQKQLEEQEPKVVLADAVTASEHSFPIKELATILAQKGVKIGPSRLRHFLIDNHYLGSRGECYMMPCQQYIEQGLFEVVEELRYNCYCNKQELKKTVMVTGKGLKYFINKFLNNKNK